MSQIQLPLMLLSISFMGVLVTGSRITIRAFKKSTICGLSSLIIPFAYMVFVIKYWKENWKLFIVHLLFLGIFIFGVISLLNSELIKQYYDIRNLDLENIDMENVKDYLKLLNGDTGI